MNCKKSYLIIIILAMLFSLASCNKEETLIKEAMTFLTSNKCEGRLQGSNGNLVAQNFIVDKFEKYGLEKIDDSYNDKFISNVTSSINSTMVIEFEDGTQYECKYGEDFIENTPININSKKEFAFYQNKNSANDAILVVANNEELEEAIKNGIEQEILLINTDVFHRSIVSINNKPYKLQISKKVYNLLNKNPKSKINICFKSQTEKKELNNIIGKISGQDNSKALIISAHFDSMGMAGNRVFTGAVDNASGTAMLLDLAKKLSDYSKTSIPKQDILFCAFNSEENSLAGSESFASKVKDKYKNVININLDCLGIRGTDTIFVSGDLENDKKLLEAVSKYFKDSGYKSEIKNIGVASDHLSFIENNISGISLSEDKIDIYHTFTDSIEKIDFSYIEKLCDDIFKGITRDNVNIFNLLTRKDSSLKGRRVKQTEKDKKYYETIFEEEKKLEFDQLKYIKIDDKTVVVSKCLENFLDSDVYKFISIYGTEEIKNIIPKYDLVSVTIEDNSSISIKDPEIGKVYTRKRYIKDARRISMNYFNNENKIFMYINPELKIATKGKILFNPYKEKETSESEYIMDALKSHYDIDINNVEINGRSYNVIKDKKGNLSGLLCKLEDEERDYYFVLSASIGKGPKPSEKEYINLINEIEYDKFMDNVLKWFE